MYVCVCVCVCVCVYVCASTSRKWDVRGVGLDNSDMRPRTLRRMFENIEHGLESSRIGEATSYKQMQSGTAVEADAIGELQLKWTLYRGAAVQGSGRNRGAAAS